MHIPDTAIWIVGGLVAVYGADYLLGSTNVAHSTVRVIEAEKKCAGPYLYKQYIDALAYCRYAADIGGINAKATLGEMYYFGRGVDKDIATAYTYALPAAQENDPRAEYVLGALLVERRYTPDDIKQGREWLTKAAAHCHSAAPAVLAGSFMGDDPKDTTTAYVWNTLSKGQAGPEERRAVLEMTLTPDQRTEATHKAVKIRAKFDPACR